MDVEKFGDPDRTNSNRVSIRNGLYRALRQAFAAVGLEWDSCHSEDRGDGALVLAPPELPKSWFVESLPDRLVEALREHNETHPDEERIRLRVALHAGEVLFDDHGVTGDAVNLTFRLVNSGQLRTALDESPGVLVLCASAWFFAEVVQQSPAALPDSYRRVDVAVKETRTAAWIRRPDEPQSPSRPAPRPVSDFERRYLESVRRRNSNFELFQVAPGRAPTGYSFEDFYVVPPITRRQTADQHSGLTGAGTDPGYAVARARRVLLLGGAGAGKTTFLTWLAYGAASGSGQEGPWNGIVPFFVSLRHFAETDLPQQPEDLLTVVAPRLPDGKPHMWATEMFTSGQAMLLVDGLDELVADRRDHAKQWLETFLRTYPRARYVVSTRPSAVDDCWLVDEPERPGLLRFELLPLSTGGLGRVIESWYNAAIQQEPDPEQQEWLRGCMASLWAGLANHPNLRTLVSSPLLAALLCALYRQNDRYLPSTRRELLAQALELLLVRWDDTKVRSTVTRRGVVVEDALRMTQTEQLILLERFAAPMVRRSELMVSRDEATARLAEAMSTLRSRALDPARLLQHLLVRTGLLRENPADQRIEFVHRTFRDYLAAANLVKSRKFHELAGNAHKDSWYEVAFMAAARAREGEVAELLDQLLRRAAHREADQEVASRLKLVAAACLGYADVVDPDSVRIRVEQATRGLIPPASFADAEMLARAGVFVVELLPGPNELPSSDRDGAAARVIRTLAMIGTEEAWEKIQLFTAMHQPTVIDELLRGWRQFDFAEDYATKLLSQVDFGDWMLEMRRWELLSRLHHLTRLRALKLIGDVPLADQRAGEYPLADIVNLHSLDIVANETIRDLTPLTRCRGLRVLRIKGPSMLRDLSAVADSTVEELTLDIMRKTQSQAGVDLASLSGARLTFLSLKHTELPTGLRALPGDLPLTELVIKSRDGHPPLAGIERFTRLRKVTVTGIPTADEMAALRQLPRLSHLALNVPDPPADLVRLRPLLPSLRELDLYRVGSGDITAATAAIGGEWTGRLRINGLLATGGV